MPLWRERVVDCRVSLSSVSSGCTKLLLVESGYPHLSSVAISLDFAGFLCQHARPSLLMFLFDQILLSSLMYESQNPAESLLPKRLTGRSPRLRIRTGTILSPFLSSLWRTDQPKQRRFLSLIRHPCKSEMTHTFSFRSKHPLSAVAVSSSSQRVIAIREPPLPRQH